MKKTLLAAALAAASINAYADIKMSGFVSAQVLDNDAVSEDLEFSRNGFSQSRFRIDSSTEWNGLEVGTNMEFGLPNEQGNINVRRNSFYVKGGFGTFRLGDHNDVGDGILNVDSTGTWNSNALTDLSFTTQISNAGNGFDPGRSQGFRYYSPKLGGVATIAAQLQNDGGWEVAGRVNVAGFKFGVYSEEGGETGGVDNNDNSGFIVGYKAPFGLSVSYTQSERDYASGATDEFAGVKVGFQTGKHKFSVTSTTRENEGNSEDLNTTGAGYEFSAAKGVLFYVAYAETDNFVEATAGSSDPLTEEEDGIAIGGIISF